MGTSYMYTGGRGVPVYTLNSDSMVSGYNDNCLIDQPHLGLPKPNKICCGIDNN